MLLNKDIVVNFIELDFLSNRATTLVFHHVANSKELVGIEFLEVNLNHADEHLKEIAVQSGYVSGCGVS